MTEKNPPDIHVTITADTSKFTEAMGRLARMTTSNHEVMQRSLAAQMRKIGEAMEASRRNMSVLVYDSETFAKTPAQIDAIYYVRGGMDPRYAAPAERDAYLRVLLKVKHHRDVAVAAFLRGWAQHRTVEPARPFAWHRLIGSTTVEVSAA